MSQLDDAVREFKEPSGPVARLNENCKSWQKKNAFNPSFDSRGERVVKTLEIVLSLRAFIPVRFVCFGIKFAVVWTVDIFRKQTD